MTLLRLCALCCLLVHLQAAQRVDLMVSPGQLQVDGSNLRPGSVIGIKAGERPFLIITGLRGTAEQPITVINVGGLVRAANTDRGYAICIYDSHHVHLTGTGHPGLTYGFQAETRKQGMFAVHVMRRSTAIEIDHVEITAAGFAGFNVKDDPKPDGSVNRGAWVMADIDLHHNYVHDVEGEGFYVGHSFYHGWQNGGTTLYPHVMQNVRIHHNRIERSGCEGIQVGSCIGGLEVTDNVIIKPGIKPFAKYQDNGMQINAAGDGLVARNVIIDAPSNGIISSALEDDPAIRFERNLIVNAGSHGIYYGGSDHCTTGSAIAAFNTIVNAGGDGIRLMNTGLRTMIVANNLLVGNRGRSLTLGGSATKTEAGNLVIDAPAAVGFRDLANGDGDLLPGSPAIGKGVMVSGLTMIPDPVGRLPRKRLDVGAWAPSAPAAADAAPEPSSKRPAFKLTMGRRKQQAATTTEEATAEQAASPPATTDAVHVDDDWRAAVAALIAEAISDGKTPLVPAGRPGSTLLEIAAISDGMLTLKGQGISMQVPLASISAKRAAETARSIDAEDLAEALAKRRD